MQSDFFPWCTLNCHFDERGSAQTSKLKSHPNASLGDLAGLHLAVCNIEVNFSSIALILESEYGPRSIFLDISKLSKEILFKAIRYSFTIFLVFVWKRREIFKIAF